MRANGFSLVEMVLVVSVVSILLAIVTLNFVDYLSRYRTEAQTRRIYSTLLQARADAAYQRRGVRVKLYARRMEVYSSLEDSSRGADPVRSEALSYLLSCNGSGDGVEGYPVDFDSMGVALRPCSVCIENRDGLAGVDSMVISEFRVAIGKKDKGDECRAPNITAR